ncbi:helix-turn-helix domain-containing protein [Cohnella sp. GCM10012308]|uniref:helix-turn-helix domain-containing protein n=1 Tax=Cohnella sp. GCM10012308 TaxID=3317329 RepID=UPI0036243EEB
MYDEADALTYGDEESDFYYHRIRRTRPFERTNHYHRTYEIYYLVSGERLYFIKEETHRVAAGSLVFIDKQQVHKSSMKDSHAHERVVINFSDAYLGMERLPYYDELFRVFRGGSRIFRLSSYEQAGVLALLNRMGAEIAGRQPGFETGLRLLLAELLLLASRLPDSGGEEGQAAAHPLHSKIADVVRHLNARYPDNVTLPDLAARFYMSPSHLSRTFKAVTGFTLVGYLNLVRVREAQTLLRETNRKIIDVAAACGFESVTHFERTFKKTAKLTPMQYRKLHDRPHG